MIIFKFTGTNPNSITLLLRVRMFIPWTGLSRIDPRAYSTDILPLNTPEYRGQL
jgi:hypothetical protein